MSDKMIKVRDMKTIRLHWFNAFCWLVLLVSGFGIVSGDVIRLVPAAWPELMQGIFGGNATLVLTHAVIGIIWAVVFVLFILFNGKDACILTSLYCLALMIPILFVFRNMNRTSKDITKVLEQTYISSKIWPS